MRATRPASTQICGTRACPRARWSIPRPSESRARSEEHTSELQSLRQLVCRLLLEKKNYSMPIAVRYTQDAFSRSGWLWHVDAKGEPLKATSYMAVEIGREVQQECRDRSRMTAQA